MRLPKAAYARLDSTRLQSRPPNSIQAIQASPIGIKPIKKRFIFLDVSLNSPKAQKSGMYTVRRQITDKAKYEYPGIVRSSELQDPKNTSVYLT